MSRDFARRINLLGLIPRPAGVGLRLCHSREGGNPGSDIFSGHPPEFTPAEAEAGVTVVTLGQIPRSLLRGSSLASARWSNHFFCRAIRLLGINANGANLKAKVFFASSRKVRLKRTVSAP